MCREEGRKSVCVHMPIELVSSKGVGVGWKRGWGGGWSPAHLIQEVLLQLPWCHGKGRREGWRGGGGVYNGSWGKGKSILRFFFLADKGKWSHVYAYKQVRSVTPRIGGKAVRRSSGGEGKKELCCASAVYERPISHSSSYLDVLDRLLKKKNTLYSGYLWAKYFLTESCNSANTTGRSVKASKDRLLDTGKLSDAMMICGFIIIIIKLICSLFSYLILCPAIALKPVGFWLIFFTNEHFCFKLI